jgi:hypothetical protein
MTVRIKQHHPSPPISSPLLGEGGGEGVPIPPLSPPFPSYLLQYLLIFPLISSFLHHVTWTDHMTTHVTLGQVIHTMTHKAEGLYYRYQTLSCHDSLW